MRGDCHLTVGDLKKKLEGLPDDMPVLYQRIEDEYFDNHNWTTKELLWERHKLPEKFRHEYPEEFIEEINGEIYFRDMSNYIRAFSCYKHSEEDVFVINAHY